MAKKPTSWITIPEAKLHTPVEKAGETKKTASSGGSEVVKNKWAWGIGFVVMMVAAFAVLAPNQFSSLLKGSLFDTSGLPEGEGGVISPLNLLPTQEQMTGQAEEATVPETPPAEEPTPVEETPVSEPEPVLEAQEQPEAISVEPVTQPEAVSIEPVSTGPADCAGDVNCLLPHLQDCSAAKGNLSYKVLSQDVQASVEISGAEGENCLVRAVIAQAPLDLSGKEALCKLPKGAYTQDSLLANFMDADKMAQSCTGSAVDALKGYLVAASLAGSQNQLVQQLLTQVQQLQNQKDQSTQMVQDLVNMVQNEGVKPVAPVAQPTYGTQTTTALQPNFRANPYRVTISPEEMLRRNSTSGVSGVQPTSIAYQQYQAPYQPITGQGTPETGPAETMALMVAFLGLVAWKFKRTFLTARD